MTDRTERLPRPESDPLDDEVTAAVTPQHDVHLRQHDGQLTQHDGHSSEHAVGVSEQDDTVSTVGRDEVDALVSGPHPESDSSAPPASSRRGRLLGVLALLAALACIPLEVAAVTVASEGGGVAGIALAVALIALTVVAFVLGVIALIAGRGRIWGAIAALVAVASNPLVQIAVLGAIDGGARS